MNIQKLVKKRKYKETTDVDFTQYSRMLVYISEIDELKNITNEVKNIRATVVNYANLKDTNIKNYLIYYK